MREGSYGGLIKLTNNNVIELALPATTSSVVASSSAKGPPKQYPNKFNVSQMALQFCFSFYRFGNTNQLHCTSHLRLYKR